MIDALTALLILGLTLPPTYNLFIHSMEVKDKRVQIVNQQLKESERYEKTLEAMLTE